MLEVEKLGGLRLTRAAELLEAAVEETLTRRKGRERAQSRRHCCVLRMMVRAGGTSVGIRSSELKNEHGHIGSPLKVDQRDADVKTGDGHHSARSEYSACLIQRNMKRTRCGY